MLIHINGFPGVGKLTVARELEKLTAGRLIGNHAIINLAYLATDHGTPEYFNLHKNLTVALYDSLTRSQILTPLIFTNALAAELPEDIDRFEQARTLANARKEAFVPVLLTCDLAENKSRLSQPDRAERQKLTRPDVLEDIFAKYTAYHPAGDPNGLHLDTTMSTPLETAVIIKHHCDNLAPV